MATSIALGICESFAVARESETSHSDPRRDADGLSSRYRRVAQGLHPQVLASDAIRHEIQSISFTGPGRAQGVREILRYQPSVTIIDGEYGDLILAGTVADDVGKRISDG